MLRMKEYVKAKSVEEAFELLQKNRKNRIIGGMMWMRLQDVQIPVGIDISDCGLDQIEETEDEVKIGAMVTLRELETSPVIQGLYNGVISSSVKDIVGVQFRNTATVGGSIYSRFGFSDVLTSMLALTCDVVLHKGGRMSLAGFAARPLEMEEKDILTHIIIKKGPGKACYLSERRSATDFPVLAVCVAQIDGEWRISVGARPARAKLAKMPCCAAGGFDAKKAANEFDLYSNMRGSWEYRKLLAETLIGRAVKSIEAMEEEECTC